MSYFLAGNWPYWKPELIESHPDELLKARLTFLDSSKSLVEHDLYALTQGLEGRTTNPISLLVRIKFCLFGFPNDQQCFMFIAR